MHDLLQEMGTRIAYENSSRLCIQRREDIPRVTLGDKSGYDVEILVLDLYGEEEVSLNWLQNLTKLRILVILNGHFIKLPRKLPNSIRWLEWSNSCLTSISFGFLPPNLLVIEMPCSIIKEFLTNTSKVQKFINLTHMNLNGSKHLREMIDISSIPNLEVLKLTGCIELRKIPNLVENQSLVLIDLEGCSKVDNLPNLPTTITHLSMSKSGIKEIPLFIGNLINLKYLFASNCRNLISVSNSIYKLPNVICIYLKYCRNLPELPEAENSMISSNPTSAIGYMDMIDLSGNKFVSLPINTPKFIHIRSLHLNDCEWLVEIPELPRTLQWLHARNCKSLERFSQFQFNESFEGDFSNCHKIRENENKSWTEMAQRQQWRNEDYFCWKYSYNIVIPGNEIPEWFSYTFDCEEGIDHSFKPPLSMRNDNLICFAWCVVFQVPTSIRSFAIRFIMNEFTFYRFDLHSPLESEHMWLGFCAGFDVPKSLEAEEISCQFDSSHRAILKRVGVHIIYRN